MWKIGYSQFVLTEKYTKQHIHVQRAQPHQVGMDRRSWWCLESSWKTPRRRLLTDGQSQEPVECWWVPRRLPGPWWTMCWQRRGATWWSKMSPGSRKGLQPASCNGPNLHNTRTAHHTYKPSLAITKAVSWTCISHRVCFYCSWCNTSTYTEMIRLTHPAGKTNVSLILSLCTKNPHKILKMQSVTDM